MNEVPRAPLGALKASVHKSVSEFSTSDKESLRGKAIAQACERALNEKKVYEEKLGVRLALKGFSTINDLTRPGLRGATTPEVDKTMTYTGILSDPSFRMPLPALEQREDSASLFGEVSAKVMVTLVFVVESK